MLLKTSPHRLGQPARIWSSALARGTALCTLLATACGDGSLQRSAADPPAVVVRHDFGTLRHGQVAEALLEVPLPQDGRAFRPLAFRKDCSCGTAEFVVRGADGALREAGATPLSNLVVRPGESLLMKLSIDTRVKEAVDQPRLTYHGSVVVQDAARDRDRLWVPAEFAFAIDAPIRVLPAAHVDFGGLPRTTTYRQTLELHPDGGPGTVRFGEPVCFDERLSARLRVEGGVTVLDIEFRPRRHDAPGPVRTAVEVPTDLENGYVLPIPVSGELLPDVVVEPMDIIGFDRIDFRKPAERYVNLIDHDFTRPPGFAILDIRDSKGASLAEHFEATLQPIEGAPRSSRLILRYKGTLRARSFRGAVRLTKPGKREVVAVIRFVGFDRNPQRAKSDSR